MNQPQSRSSREIELIHKFLDQRAESLPPNEWWESIDECRIRGCDRKNTARGMCDKHYRRYFVGSDSECLVFDCDSMPKKHGLCYKHWARLQRYGSTDDTVLTRVPPGTHTNAPCAVPECNDVTKKGCGAYCDHHYHSLRYWGDPTKAQRRESYSLKGVQCATEGCNQPAHCLLLCRRHYGQLQFERGTGGICNVSGCATVSQVVKSGMCLKHHRRMLKYGDPTHRVIRDTPPPECIIDGCANIAGKNSGGGLCPRHYLQQRTRYGIFKTQQVTTPCTVRNCEYQAVIRGWCSKHYQRWYKYGDPDRTIQKKYDGEICKVEKCSSKARSLDMCRKHYIRHLRSGKRTKDKT